MPSRALELAVQSDRPADGEGVVFLPLLRTIEADALRYAMVTVEIDRAKCTASWTVKAPTGVQPTDIAGIKATGADESGNATTFYSNGLKGRYEEGKRVDDHVLKGQTDKVLEARNGELIKKEVPMLNARNEVLCDDDIKDSIAGVER
ncbi:MAG: hypothetical protein ACI9I0_001366 [Rhodoferax sp.]|jgi:hypothetical protein